MLKDRRILVEAELDKAKHLAATRYLHLIKSGADPSDQVYQTLQGKVRDAMAYTLVSSSKGSRLYLSAVSGKDQYSCVLSLDSGYFAKNEQLFPVFGDFEFEEPSYEDLAVMYQTSERLLTLVSLDGGAEPLLLIEDAVVVNHSIHSEGFDSSLLNHITETLTGEEQ